MNTSKLIAAAGISLTAALFTTTASATVLTFDQVGITNGITVDQDYGDRVTGASDLSGSYGTAGGATGNVVVEYLNLGPNVSLLWTGGYNDLDNVLYVEPDGTADPMAIRFTADAGYNVVLNEFTIGNYGGAVTLPNIRVSNGNTSLFSIDNFALASTSGSASVFSPNVQGQELTLIVDLFGLGGSSDNIGLDNISFSQIVVAAVPLPAGSLLLLSGLSGFAAFNRRKQRSA